MPNFNASNLSLPDSPEHIKPKYFKIKRLSYKAIQNSRIHVKSNCSWLLSHDPNVTSIVSVYTCGYLNFIAIALPHTVEHMWDRISAPLQCFLKVILKNRESSLNSNLSKVLL